MKKLLIVICAIMLPLQMFAQDSDQDIKKRVHEIVAELNDRIASMTRRDITMQQRNRYKDAALSLFLGKGQPFVMNGQSVQGVTVETSKVNSLGRVIKNTRPTRVYFTRIIDLMQNGVSTEVEIIDCDVYVLQSSRLVGDGLYEHKYLYSPRWTKDRFVCSEEEQMITIVLDEAEPPSIVLGDIKVGEAQRTYSN